MLMKLGVDHYVLKLHKVYINDDPDMTFAPIKTISNLLNLVFVLRVDPDIR